MVIQACQQRSTGWRTERCHVKVGIPQTVFRQRVHVGSLDGGPETAQVSESGVVQKDYEDVRGLAIVWGMK
jgi:hypothetical protein